MDILVFEDDRLDDLTPITLARPAFQIMCGSYCLLDCLQRLDLPIVPIVRDYLRALVLQDFPRLQATRIADAASPCLLVNARLVPSHDNFRILESLVRDASPALVHADGAVAAALLPSHLLPAETSWTPSRFAKTIADLGTEAIPIRDLDMALFGYPHDVIRYNELILGDNLEFRIKSPDFREARPGVFVAREVRLDEHVAVDARRGPIVLDRGVTIGPHAFLSGPGYVGPDTRVIEHAAIKHGVSIGHTAKIGGEVEASVIESYSNKQHHGFLGHSYLGSWINLGAGTCNSDLKNTYGLVNVECRGRRVATGMQFVGCIMGDYAKTAINTGIFTGKTIGVCSMLYGFVTTNVPSFVNYARLFGQITQLPPDVMIATQRRMFARRAVQQRPCDIQLIRDMFIQTNDERRSVTSAESISL